MLMLISNRDVSVFPVSVSLIIFIEITTPFCKSLGILIISVRLSYYLLKLQQI